MSKMLLEHSHARWLTYCLWLFLHCNWQLSVTETIWPTKSKTFAIWLFTGKLLTLVLPHGLCTVGTLGCRGQDVIL